MINLTLEYPPSVNNYWERSRHGGMRLTDEARTYKKLIKWMLVAKKLGKPLEGRISAKLTVYPPDRRRRDLDNVLKAVLDAMEGAVYIDDSQIDVLVIERGRVIKDGKVTVDIEVINEA